MQYVEVTPRGFMPIVVECEFYGSARRGTRTVEIDGLFFARPRIVRDPATGVKRAHYYPLPAKVESRIDADDLRAALLAADADAAE